MRVFIDMKHRSIRGTYLIGGPRSGEFYNCKFYPDESILIHHHEPHEELYEFNRLPPLVPVKIKAYRYVAYRVRYPIKQNHIERWILVHESLISNDDYSPLCESAINQVKELLESDLSYWGVLQ